MGARGGTWVDDRGEGVFGEDDFSNEVLALPRLDRRVVAKRPLGRRLRSRYTLCRPLLLSVTRITESSGAEGLFEGRRSTIPELPMSLRSTFEHRPPLEGALWQRL